MAASGRYSNTVVFQYGDGAGRRNSEALTVNFGQALWLNSVVRLTIVFTLALVLLSCVVLRSVIGSLVVGGAAGGGMTAMGWRYSNRTAMLIGISVVMSAALVLLGGFSCVSLGNANIEFPVTFEVYDGTTGLPIAGAKVRIRDLASHNWAAGPPDSTIPGGEAGAGGATDQRGQAKVTYRFIASTRETYFTRSARVFVNGYLYLTAAAPGYTPRTAPLHKYTGSHVENGLDGTSLAHVRISLEPEVKRAGSNTSSSRESR